MAVDEFLFLGFRLAPRFLLFFVDFFSFSSLGSEMANDPERQSNKFYDLKINAFYKKRYDDVVKGFDGSQRSWEIAHKRDVSDVMLS